MKVVIRHNILSSITDAASFISAYWVTYGLWHFLAGTSLAGDIPGAVVFTQFFALALMAQFLVFLWEGVYHQTGSLLEIHASRRLLRGLLIAPIPILTISFIPLFASIDKPMIIVACMLNLLINPMMRSMFVINQLPQFDKNVPPKKLLILGNGTAGECLLRRIVEDLQSRYQLIGFLERSSERVGQRVTTNSLEIKGSTQVLGSYSHLERFTLGSKLDEVWINDPALSTTELDRIFKVCKENEIEVSLVPTIGDYPPQSLEVEMLDIVPIIRKRQVVQRPFYEFFKRIFDLSISAMLLLFFTPIMGTIALLIKRDSPGPVFFTQTRIGRNGKPFKIYKFRSMQADSDPYDMSPENIDDERITKIGKLFRRTSLDELPQLFNVFLGSMSLVGPRPEMPFIVQQYNDMQRMRLAVKPGVTGPWQVSADRSIPIHQNLDYDLFYIQNRSILLDLTLLWRTLFITMKGI